MLWQTKLTKTNKSTHTHTWYSTFQTTNIINVVLTKRCQIWKKQTFRNEYVCVFSVQDSSQWSSISIWKMRKWGSTMYHMQKVKLIFWHFKIFLTIGPGMQTQSYEQHVLQLTTMKWYHTKFLQLLKKQLEFKHTHTKKKYHSAFWHVRFSTFYMAHGPKSKQMKIVNSMHIQKLLPFKMWWNWITEQSNSIIKMVIFALLIDGNLLPTWKRYMKTNCILNSTTTINDTNYNNNYYYQNIKFGAVKESYWILCQVPYFLTSLKERFGFCNSKVL